MEKKNPIWIVVDDGEFFEGHQGHWADCFFTNAHQSEIEAFCSVGQFKDVKLVITEMTDEQVVKYPEAVAFRDWLIEQYGEC